MNILEKIIAQKKTDIASLGFEEGACVPKTRDFCVRPFLKERGAILEIKRASPSKGKIASHLDAAKTALQYAAAGAKAISVLTEKNYFDGSLDDLIAVRTALEDWAKKNDTPPPAVLRKDFLTELQDIDVAFRAGADAVLLIACVLQKEQMLSLCQKVLSHKMSALIEVREEEDLEKIEFVFSKIDFKNFVFGVNSRNLKDFSVDTLVPLLMKSKIQKILPGAKVIFESGILSEKFSAFVCECGFFGFLMGEAAAKNPENACKFIFSFENAAKKTQNFSNAQFWKKYAFLLNEKKSQSKKTPLVKICGITRESDAILAAECGADFLGFVFCKKSPRNTNADFVKKVRFVLQKKCEKKMPLFVAVVTDTQSEEAKAALLLAKEKIVDAIQFHAISKEKIEQQNLDVPHFFAVNVESKNDILKIKSLLESGEVRVLIDARSKNAVGGTGKTVDGGLVLLCKKESPLWLAGGINSKNVFKIANEFCPEFIDIASGTESECGIKDEKKLRAIFSELEK